MSKSRKFADLGEQKSDMTPMIDMVFQLIIFFVVVSDFSSTQVEALTLPDAIRADTEALRETDRVIIINILADGATRINRQTYAGPDPKTGQMLPDKIIKDHLQIEAQLAGMEDNPETPGKKLSKLRVVIRVDQHCPYEHVQRVMKACAENGIYKTQINANQDLLRDARL